MSLKIYNTRTRSVEPFEPLQPGRVRIYMCGLTPSAQAHLGHARSFLFFDVLRRYLAHKGFRVHYVQNVTDIDDRSINRARETGEHWYDIVTGYYAGFKASMKRLGVLEPDEEPYATQFIGPIVEMIAALVAQGYAYASKEGVYYRVSAFPRYGALANRNIEELEAGARIEVDADKEDPLDFALWKFAKPGEPTWPSPWGDGRPGWHIECSAMSRSLLDPPGEGFEIHGGGADLIFPHHENEVAQSEPLMQHPPMAKYWMHGGLLLFENQKMSKSLGNFEPLEELLGRHDPQAIRLLFLQTGYRKVMNFTEESVTAAAVTLERLKKTYRALMHSPGQEDGGLIARMETALDEDLNTAVALAELLAYKGTSAGAFAYALQLLGIQAGEAWLAQPSAELPADFASRLRAALGQAAFDSESPQAALENVIALRTRARQSKNWAESDRLRDILLECGIALKDSKDGTAWSLAAQK
ncbi:MAG: cysteine--tRNA ligase [Candidatus Baltobacteraceae bacterium]